MAKALSDLDARQLIEEHDGRVKNRYPWHAWLDGGWWLIIRNEDYKVEDKVFENAVYRMKPWAGQITLRRVPDGYLLKSLENGERYDSSSYNR